MKKLHQIKCHLFPFGDNQVCSFFATLYTRGICYCSKYPLFSINVPVFCIIIILY